MPECPPDHGSTTGTEQIMAIYHEEIHSLYAMIARRTGHDRALAEDIVQETWLRAIRDWSKRGLPRTPGGWLRTVALNLLRDHVRRRRPDVIPASALDQWLDHEPCRISAAISDTVVWGIAQLHPRQAHLIGAFHIDGRSVKQIAAELKLSEKAVERRLSRARIKLRAVLARTIIAEATPTSLPERAACEVHSSAG